MDFHTANNGHQKTMTDNNTGSTYNLIDEYEHLDTYNNYQTANVLVNPTSNNNCGGVICCGANGNWCRQYRIYKTILLILVLLVLLPLFAHRSLLNVCIVNYNNLNWNYLIILYYF